MINTSVINYEFRYLTATRPYPFADNATYTDITGRSIPYNIFIDGLLYPEEISEGVFLSRIFIDGNNKLTAEFSNNTTVIGCMYNVTDGANYVIGGPYCPRPPETASFITPEERVIGSFVLQNTEYLYGLAAVYTLEFMSDTMTLDSSRIQPIDRIQESITINGTTIPVNKKINICFDSDRFSIIKNPITDVSALSYFTEVVTKSNETTIKTINGICFETNSCVIYSPHKISEDTYSDIRVVTEDDGITLLRVGDD